MFMRQCAGFSPVRPSFFISTNLAFSDEPKDEASLTFQLQGDWHMLKFCFTTLPCGQLTEGGRLTEGTEGRNPGHERGWIGRWGLGLSLWQSSPSCYHFCDPTAAAGRGAAPPGQMVVFSGVLPAAADDSKAENADGQMAWSFFAILGK